MEEKSSEQEERQYWIVRESSRMTVEGESTVRLRSTHVLHQCEKGECETGV